MDQEERSIEQEEHTYAMLCHLLAFSAFVGVPFGHIVGPLVIWLLKRDVSPVVDAHGKDSLNFQISFSLYTLGASIASFFIGLFTCGVGLVLMVPLCAALVVANIVLVILAATAAYNGRRYVYPYTIRFIA